MAGGDSTPVVYWDTSAILSALFTDSHSATAKEWADKPGLHLLSTFAYTETCAVISRMKREKIVTDILVKAAYEHIEEGPWRRMNAYPGWGEIQELSLKWPLRGADLFHLATVKAMQEELPWLFLLTFDTRLGDAAKGEGL
jgi:predicted nucleic acid-binding protein